MKTKGNTVLITGGSAGIGFEIAKLFTQRGNRVIITGRNPERLKTAAGLLKNATPVVADVTSKEDIRQLAARVQRDFPELNMLINNAGYADTYKLGVGVNAAEKAEQEMLTNYLSVIRLTETFFPILSDKPEAAIVNISSIAAFRPAKVVPTYSASKAALHIYSEVLRTTLAENSNVEVYEVVAPLVNTEFSKSIGGAAGIPPQEVANELLRALEKKEWLVLVGKSKELASRLTQVDGFA